MEATGPRYHYKSASSVYVLAQNSIEIQDSVFQELGAVAAAPKFHPSTAYLSVSVVLCVLKSPAMKARNSCFHSRFFWPVQSSFRFDYYENYHEQMLNRY